MADKLRVVYYYRMLMRTFLAAAAAAATVMRCCYTYEALKALFNNVLLLPASMMVGPGALLASLWHFRVRLLDEIRNCACTISNNMPFPQKEIIMLISFFSENTMCSSENLVRM